jgi:transcriptional regulator with XRE-family HTH domain
MGNTYPDINWGFKQSCAAGGFTFEKLSRRSGINRAYLSMSARGRYNLSPSQIERLALILNVSPDQLGA